MESEEGRKEGERGMRRWESGWHGGGDAVAVARGCSCGGARVQGAAGARHSAPPLRAPCRGGAHPPPRAALIAAHERGSAGPAAGAGGRAIAGWRWGGREGPGLGCRTSEQPALPCPGHSPRVQQRPCPRALSNPLTHATVSLALSSHAQEILTLRDVYTGDIARMQKDAGGLGCGGWGAGGVGGSRCAVPALHAAHSPRVAALRARRPVLSPTLPRPLSAASGSVALKRPGRTRQPARVPAPAPLSRQPPTRPPAPCRLPGAAPAQRAGGRERGRPGGQGGGGGGRDQPAGEAGSAAHEGHVPPRAFAARVQQPVRGLALPPSAVTASRCGRASLQDKLLAMADQIAPPVPPPPPPRSPLLSLSNST